MEEQLKAEGRNVVRVGIEPDVFRRWCESKGLPMNREARSRFAGEGAADTPEPPRPKKGKS
jgi:hypothetical protein